MSTDLIELPDVQLTAFAGGTASTAGRRARGRCYQISEHGQYVQLTRAEAVQVALAILEYEGVTRPT